MPTRHQWCGLKCLLNFVFLLFLFSWFVRTFPAFAHKTVFLRLAFVILAMFFPLIALGAQFLLNSPDNPMTVVVSQIDFYLLFLYGFPVTCPSTCPGAVLAMHIQAVPVGPVFVIFPHVFPREAFNAEFLLPAVSLPMRFFILVVSLCHLLSFPNSVFLLN